ncbi:PadR family transcriptional regulator [Burkholderia thailandensis]|uniref:Transcriptional regulator, PadR family n=1 Tax=Burkholderia thailandensis (strain ATCC 700388 / DSM 13276 / CCUG 48851 / CIP 106301 / E264) TaxID=271848 RepID=Q2T9C3_BURTA|nr:PadR family transcriptional regulator [Burkholderia thailandensis]ABC34311.1 transcriptional regulator, PadR family [Burkholderia thailandensis E264]AHI75911.1 transcriptional regulator PadR-like family protein [Burkholderia thailandensis 2002721723]AHI81734.1 transcriptional regulator PadR-like family protein [Burkholderia thailandensis E444]AIC90368.1 transcriptional regulator PadR-like family protein [Burkholderia thailandensis USAMRU Malaysia \
MRHAHRFSRRECGMHDSSGHGPLDMFRQMFGGHRRGGGRHGFGPFGGFGGGPGGFGGFGGDDAMPRGRQFSANDLQLLLLALLAEQPSHGYELIKALDTRSSGFYTPSPGMVYPALTYLEELGYVTVQVEGNRKRYALADAGRAHLDAQRERVEMLFAKLAHLGRKMEFMRRAFAGEAPAAPDDDTRGWLPEFVEARMALKQALLRKSSAGADEQRRIAAILRRAVADIEGRTED